MSKSRKKLEKKNMAKEYISEVFDVDLAEMKVESGETREKVKRLMRCFGLFDEAAIYLENKTGERFKQI